MSKLNDILKLLMYETNCNTNSWSGISNIIKAGIANSQLQIGQEFANTQIDGTGVRRNWPIEVAHIYQNGNVAFKFKYLFSTALPFDMPEAIFYGALEPGKYYITTGETINSNWASDVNLIFEIKEPPQQLQSIADEYQMLATDQLVINIPSSNKVLNSSNTNVTFSIYPKGSTSSKSYLDDSISISNTAPGDATLLGTIYKNTTSGTYAAQLNCANHVLNGSNRYKDSIIRQWLNSDNATSNWWTAQNPWDRPPTGNLLPTKGFLALLDNDSLLEAIEESKIITNWYNNSDWNSEYDITQDKFFIPSLTEMYSTIDTNNNDILDGAAWDYYKIKSSNGSKFNNNTTQYKQLHTNTYISPNVINGHTSYWTRSAYKSVSSCYVFAEGVTSAQDSTPKDCFSYITVNNSISVLPCFILNKSLLT